MTTTDAPRTASSETQVLFPEARQRRHRRWVIGIAVLVVVAGAGLALLLSYGSNATNPNVRRVGLPRWAPSLARPKPAPTVFVAGDGNGGVGLYSTTSGHLIRTLSPQTSGGPDQQIVLSKDRKSVYFAQPSGPCSGQILSGPVSGTIAPAVVISAPGDLALAPSPSPVSDEVAWVGATCGRSGSTTSSTLYVTDLGRRVTSELGGYSGQLSDNEIGWSPNGELLAVQSGSTVEVLHVTSPSPESDSALKVSAGCRLASPAFLTETQIAAIQTCYDSAGELLTSGALVFSTATRRPVALIASAPQGSTFQGLSIDSSGQHILLGVANAMGAEDVQVESGRLVAVGQHPPTDAQW
jgi:hypothetical protein